MGGAPLGGSSAVPLPPVLPPPVFGRAGGAAKEAPPPGAYTQLIRESSTPAPELPGSKPAKVAPPPKKRSIPLGLIIALNVVLVLAIVLILYFVFRPTPPAATPGEGAALPAGVKAPAVPKPTVPKPTVPAIPK